VPAAVDAMSIAGNSQPPDCGTGGGGRTTPVASSSSSSSSIAASVPKRARSRTGSGGRIPSVDMTSSSGAASGRRAATSTSDRHFDVDDDIVDGRTDVVDDDYSLGADGPVVRTAPPDIAWTSEGTPVYIGRRRVSSRIANDGEVETRIERTPETATASSSRGQFLDLFANFGQPPRLVSPDRDFEFDRGGDESPFRPPANNSASPFGSAVTACGIDARTVPFMRRFFAPHADVEASLLPVLVDDRPSVTRAKRHGDKIERGVANDPAYYYGDDIPLARTRVADVAACDTDVPSRARMDDGNDLVLTPNHLRSLSTSLGRFASRGRGGRSSSSGYHDPTPLEDVDVSTQVDIREVREVASDVTKSPLARDVDSPSRVYRSPSSMSPRYRAQRGTGIMPERSPPRAKVREVEDCPRRLEVCADGGGVEVYDAGKFCTGDMTNFFPVDWGFDK
jgi:hypothetical protein